MPVAVSRLASLYFGVANGCWNWYVYMATCTSFFMDGWSGYYVVPAENDFL